ncbi:unnamed protein product [Mytilus edulis]|uniref:Uncharacterized protein n=1 Tax=Mytilus edulis TaxID=6550 RepID=A0A8S3QC94_MYTED|nr:unnamed protein product [Mytilus edulis]
MIKSYLSGEQTDWDLSLGCLAGAYRSTPNESTGLAPNLLMFGREITLALEVTLGTSQCVSNDLLTPGEFVQNSKRRLEKAHIVARKHLANNAQRRKNYYDDKDNLVTYQNFEKVGTFMKIKEVVQAVVDTLFRNETEAVLQDVYSSINGCNIHPAETETDCILVDALTESYRKAEDVSKEIHEKFKNNSPNLQRDDQDESETDPKQMLENTESLLSDTILSDVMYTSAIEISCGYGKPKFMSTPQTNRSTSGLCHHENSELIQSLITRINDLTEQCNTLADQVSNLSALSLQNIKSTNTMETQTMLDINESNINIRMTHHMGTQTEPEYTNQPIRIIKESVLRGGKHEVQTFIQQRAGEFSWFTNADKNASANINGRRDEPSSPPDNTPENTPDTEIDEIITIWSSPEKSPFKDAITIESDSSDSIYRPPYRKRVKRQLPMLSSSDESLPSLEEILTEDNVCKLVETTKTKKVQDFTSYPGELFNDLFESFTTVNRGLNVEEIFEVIINAEKYPHSVSVPQYVQKPAAFIINRENLKDPRDIRADGNGVWRIRNKAKRRYRVDHTGKLQLMKTTEVTNRSSYELWRTYSFHKETPNFRRLIIEIHGYPHAILQFYFSGDIEPVVLKPHGNAKSKHAAPYRRVAPSTLNRMIELSKSKTSAKSIMKGVINENGGIESCGPSSYPRNEQQVKNIRRTNKEEMDEATEVLHMYDNQEQPFIRKFDVRPDFIVVLASNQQLHDLKKILHNTSM